jgi:hypothetical protein
MPFQFQELTTARGMHYLRIDASDHVDLTDAKALEARLLQPNLRGGRLLSVVSKGTEYAPETRKFFGTLNDKYSLMAVVVTSPIVRAAINVMLRLAKTQGGIIRMFTSEQEAMEWLEGGKA